jgi:hypothetical protein
LLRRRRIHRRSKARFSCVALSLRSDSMFLLLRCAASAVGGVKVLLCCWFVHGVSRARRERLHFEVWIRFDSDECWALERV